MPVYHFMSMSLDTKGYKRLEEICRTYLWRKNPEGEKKSLVS